ncbi:MAG: PAC2 family protein [Chloroflexi bacterium]|nr:PAC2 family protein [Chloroflexota bacterium]
MNMEGNDAPPDSLIVHEMPEAKLPTMVVAFAGWPDAAEAATRAIRYMVRKLPATKFAEIDPEEFFDFTLVRPQTRLNRRGERTIRWPTNDFYYFAPEDESGGLLLFNGTEPNLRWRAFSNLMLSVADRCGVELVVSLGALLDEVPHTREPSVTGRATSTELEQKVEWLGIRNSNYQGPTGIHTAFMDACVRKGLSLASIWGHSPHYVNTSPNPAVSHALLTKLQSLVDFEADLEELRLAGEAFESEVTENISKDTDIVAYVERLEQRHDEAIEPPGDIPSPDDMVKELEDFLRSQRERPEGGE